MDMNGHEWQGKRVLVTGGAGFIGSHLVEALDRAGARVTVLDNLQAGKWENVQRTEVRGQKSEDGGQRTEDGSRTSKLGTGNSELRTPNSEVRCIEGDVRDADCVQRVLEEAEPDVVFHLAANASVPGSVDEPVYDFESNCAGTFVLLNTIRSMGMASRVVVASSGAVYGEPTEFPIREKSSLAPISPYGASKLGAEVEARMFSDVYEMKVSIARIFNSYGPRMPRFVVFDFLKKLQKDPTHLEILGDGKQVRDLNYVTDTVGGLMAIALKGQSGEAYNLASGTSHNVTEIAHMLLDILRLRDSTRISYSGKSWSGDAQRWEVDITKARSLGYGPATPLRKGLEEVVAWYQKTYGSIL